MRRWAGWRQIIQSPFVLMGASQEEEWRRPGSVPAWQIRGAVLLVIVVTVLSAAIWLAGQRRVPETLPVPVAQALPELRTLPGSPSHQPPAQEQTIGQDEARRLNATIPFAPTAGAPAHPFRLAGSVTDQARAVDCLAIAAMAEAGGGDAGQRAVIQVVLNRVRHPAFAKTVCGVVFEGAQRATGCQFTFTCDGALARRYSTEAWTAARRRAFEALAGWVYAPVGLATHYHTDWVHPYWSDSLIKLARVDTHLFFRWSGSWGTAPAFSAPYRGGEPAMPQLAYLPAHGDAGAQAVPLAAAHATQGSALREVVARNGDGGAFVLLAGASSAESARDMGRSICLDRPSCKVFGWFDRAEIPEGYPVPSAARAELGFSYYRDSHGGEIVLYDCARFAAVGRDSCIPPALTGRGGAAGAQVVAGREEMAATNAAEAGSPPARNRCDTEAVHAGDAPAAAACTG